MTWDTGTILTDDGEIVARPGLTAEELRPTRFAQAAGLIETVPGNPRRQVIARAPFKVGGYDLKGTAYFYDGKMTMFGFGMTREEAGRRFATAGDDDHSDELHTYQTWVELETGQRSPVRFPWGTIAATYNEKDESCAIWLVYDDGKASGLRGVGPAGKQGEDKKGTLTDLREI